MNNNVLHTLGDDIESAFWAFVYEALLYMGHLLEPVQLSQQMNYFFDENTRREDGWVCIRRVSKVEFVFNPMHA